MPFRDPGLSERIRQGNILSKRDESTSVGTSAGAAQAKALAMQSWIQGDVGSKPSVTSAPPPLIGGQPFSELRAANPGPFQEWADRVFGGNGKPGTYAGFEFLAPPPEPQADSGSGGGAPTDSSSSSSSQEAA